MAQNQHFFVTLDISQGGIAVMALFDVSKYEMPAKENVDMERTKYNVGVFLGEYLASRSRVGQPREPKITSSFSLVPPTHSSVNHPEAEQLLIQNETAQEEFTYFHKLFVQGFSAVQHPFKPDITKRRKQIFYDRYIHGYSVNFTAERCHVSEELVKQESSVILIQFASALELVRFK